MYLTIASPTSHFAIEGTPRTETARRRERERRTADAIHRVATRRIYETGSCVSPLALAGKKLDTRTPSTCSLEEAP